MSTIMNTIPSLQRILNNDSDAPYSLEEFKTFLKKASCYENYIFLIELQKFIDFQHDYELQRSDSRPGEQTMNRRKFENKIDDFQMINKRLEWYNFVKKFVEVCSEYEINFNEDMRAKLFGNLEKCTNESISLEIPNIAILKAAKDEVYVLLQDAYMQFMKSTQLQEDNSKLTDTETLRYKNLEISARLQKHSSTISSYTSELPYIGFNGFGNNYCLDKSANKGTRNLSPVSKTSSESMADSMDLSMPGLGMFLSKNTESQGTLRSDIDVDEKPLINLIESIEDIEVDLDAENDVKVDVVNGEDTVVPRGFCKEKYGKSEKFKNTCYKMGRKFKLRY